MTLASSRCRECHHRTRATCHHYGDRSGAAFDRADFVIRRRPARGRGVCSAVDQPPDRRRRPTPSRRSRPAGPAPRPRVAAAAGRPRRDLAAIHELARAASPRSSRWSASAGWGRAGSPPSSRSAHAREPRRPDRQRAPRRRQRRSLVLPAIAGALGVADEPGRPLAEALAEALGDAPTLLVLDTMEHVRSAAPGARRPPRPDAGPDDPRHEPRRARRAARAGRVAGAAGRPGRAATDEAETLLDSPAAALFLERARVVRPDVEVTPANAALIAAHLPPPRRHPAGHRARRGGAPRPGPAPAPGPAARPSRLAAGP